MPLQLSPADLLGRVNRDVERSYLRARNGLRYVRGSNRPGLGTTPKDVVWQRDKAQLWRYRGGPVRFAQPLLIVTSLVSRSYILDLLPGQQCGRVPARSRLRRLPARLGDPRRARRRQQPRDVRRRVPPARRGGGAAARPVAASSRWPATASAACSPCSTPTVTTTPGVRNLVLMATPVDFEEMGADGRRAARGPARPRGPDRRERERAGRRPLQRVLHARADHDRGPAGDAAGEPLERRVRARLPGDGAVDARPGPVPRRGLPRGGRAVRPAQRADGRIAARRRARDRLRDDGGDGAQRDGRARTPSCRGRRPSRPVRWSAGRTAGTSCCSREATSRSGPAARRSGTPCRSLAGWIAAHSDELPQERGS